MNKRLTLPLTLLAAFATSAFAQTPAAPASAALSAEVTGLTSGLTARTTAPRYTSSPVRLSIMLQNSSAQAQDLSAARDNRQGCVAGFMVRVLEVGSRKVVYPAEGGEPMLCAQDMWTQTVPAGASVRLERTLELPAGDYMIESWFGGNAGNGSVKLAAEPVRVTVW